MSDMEEHTPEYTELIDCYALHISENTGTSYAAARIQGMAGVAKIRAEAKADAWDEAVNEARARLMMMSMDEDELKAANPYRKENNMNEKQPQWAVIGEQGPELVCPKGMRIYDAETGEEQPGQGSDE